MISNQILQNTIEGLKGISGVDFIVLDTDGNEVAQTSRNEFDYTPEVVEFVTSPADSQELSKYLFFKIYDDQSPEYILVVVGSGDNSYLVGKMAAFQMQGLMVAYK